MRKKENPESDWATPAGLLKNLGKRPIGIANEEENRIHRELVNTPGTPENLEHQRNLTRKIKSESR